MSTEETTLPPNLESLATDQTTKKTVATVESHGSTTQDIVQVYRDAGAIGVAMISVVLLAVIMAFLLFRVIKMYVELSNGRDKNELLRMQNSNALTGKVNELEKGIAGLFEKTVVLAERGHFDAQRNSEMIEKLNVKIEGVDEQLNRVLVVLERDNKNA